MTVYRFMAKGYERFAAAVWALGAVLFFGYASPALAHKVTVFAWAEGDTVFTESKFSGGRKAKGARITVYDAHGDRRVTGKTDDQGKFSFKIPGPTALKVVLTAGTGHQNSWTLPAAEIEAALAADGVAPAASLNHPQLSPPPDPATGSAPAPAAGNAGTAAAFVPDIRVVVETALDKKLGPIRARLDRMQARQEKAGAMDILGGIGYILGLVGIGAYVHARKKTG